MISTRIIDNDMGHVMKVPLTGRGTVHGINIHLSFVIGQQMNNLTKKMEDVLEYVTLPEIDMGLLEMLGTDMGVKRFSEHCEEHLNNAEREAAFIESYKTFVTPLNKSGKDRY
jgi:hypothetical protein